ncbi:unnamed protein product [Ilex paraguariensis]|uniref:DUF4378 domain-containing protein n=1 Tax=Ilex paraguariensis TaxID=185542 RepID=A0ABC8V433_9AQUA
MEEMGEHSSTSNNSGREKEPDYKYPSPVSSFESPFSEGSCNSSDCTRNFTGTGCNQCLSADAHEMLDWISSQKSQPVEGEPELSDSATSIFVGSMNRKGIITAFSSANVEGSSHCEFEYIQDILSDADLMLKDFALGQAHQVITPDLFDRLENQRTKLNRSMEEQFELGRKVLFDCVCECLKFRCGRLIGGSCKAWAKWTTLFHRKEWLAEELYKEISGWTSMEDLMVDEVVDKDMSSQYGKWVDFEIEAFEEGLEIEKGILISLVDELVDDLFQC